MAAVECARNRRCPRALRSLARTHNSRRAQLPGALLLAVVPPLQAVTRRKLSFRLPAKLRSCSGRPRSAIAGMNSTRSWLATVVASPGLAHFPARRTRQRRFDQGRRPMGPFPAVSPADSAGRGTRRGRYLLVHSLPTSPASPGRTGRPCRRPGWRPQPPDAPPAPRSAEAACPGTRGTSRNRY